MMARLSFMLSSVLVGLAICDVLPAAAQETASLNPMAGVEKAALKGFLECPLFDPTRRLPPVEAEMPVVVQAPIVTPPEPPPTLHLLGVVRGARDMAIVHRDNEEKTLVLRTGDHLGNWTVTVLPPVGVRLTNGKRGFDYALFGPPGGSVGPVAVDLGAQRGATPEAVAAHDAR